MLPHLHSIKHWACTVCVALIISGCSGAQTKSGLSDEEAAQAQATEAQIRIEKEFNTGLEAYRAGDLKKAEGIFFAMSRAYPGYAAIYANLAMVYAEQGMANKAEEAFIDSIQIKPDQPELYNLIGIMYRKQGEYGQAMLKYQEGLEIAPDNPNLLANMGVLYDLYLGQPEEAVKYFQRHQELLPDDKQMKIWQADLMQRVMK